MIINRLCLKNFGKFQNREIFLKEGINIIYGENESGKSTIHAFLQGIFFGIRRMRGRASRTDTYTKYTPWENPGWYEGSVSFTCGQRRFRLERRFSNPGEDATLLCETDGELLSVRDGDLEMLLGNISETVYQNTVSIGQAKSRTEEGLYKELRDYLANFQGSGDIRFDPEKAADILKSKKKNWEKREAQVLSRKERAEEEVKYKIEHEEEEIRNLKSRLKDLPIRKVPQEKKTEKSPEKPQTARVISAAMLLLLAVLAAAAVLGKVPWGAVLPLTALILGTEILLWKGKITGRKSGEEEESIPEEINTQERRKILLENLEERKIRLENLKEEYEEMQEYDREILEIRKEIHCIETAGIKLRETMRIMQNLTGSRLQNTMSEIISSMTEGKYRRVLLDEALSVRLDTGNQCLQLHQVSYGTAEQVYLALRMACFDILCQEEDLPLILDETFAMYDDKRLSQTLKWLSRRKSQVIIFSCNKREIQALEELHLPYTLTQL